MSEKYYYSNKSQKQRARQKRKRRRRRVRNVFLVIAIVLVVGYFAVPAIETRLSGGQSGSVSLMADNPELEAFMKKYEKGNYKSGQEIEYTKKEKEADFPQLMQWDKRWGYDPYGSSVIGITGCAPTTMSMVIMGLNDDYSVNPRVLADYSTKNGFYEEGTGTSWSFFAACAEEYGIDCYEISLSRESILEEVQSGHPVVCGMRPGHFTTSGHFIVIVGEKDGEFIIHDPNNVSNCERTWDYDTIANEIKVLWAFS